MEQESKLCANNCGFFGSSATSNLCSKCYKDSFLAKNIAIRDSKAATVAAAAAGGEEESSSSSAGEPAAAAGAAKRCGLCKKKVGLMGFGCRCGGVFCSVHRYFDKHGCEFDYRREGKDAIEKANPIVKAEKIDKI